MPFQAERPPNLCQFCGDGPWVSMLAQFHQLFGYRRRTGVGYSLSENLPQRSTCGQKIDPGMYAESFVFGAECCGDDIVRNVAQLAAQTINALVLQNPAQGSPQAIHKFNTLR